jgi:CRISPR-associated protein Cmr5
MSNGTSRTALEQGRAAQAYTYAEEGAKLPKAKEYKAYVKKMPMLIKTNGLGAAIAFAFAKGAKNGEASQKDPWGLLYFQIEDWLKKDHIKFIENLNTNTLAKRLTEVNSPIYRSITNEVLALLNWLKRFADALIEGESQE